jgi:MarR family 2-MHQ and catechol resistance regulon transcriptional repressor
MAVSRQPAPDENEQRLTAFLAKRGADIDAHGAMFLLYRTHTDTAAAMEAAALRPLGLTHAGFLLMMTLWTSGPQETRALAEILRVSKPSIVSSVDTLERMELVRRVRSDVDRRLVTVTLTRSGTRLIERASDRWQASVREMASVLTQAEQRTLARLLRKVDRQARRQQGEEDA